MTPLEIVTKKRTEAIGRIVSSGYLKGKRVSVGMATCEIAAGSKEVYDVFKEAMSGGLANVYLSQKGCVGRCNLEPTVEVIEEGKIPVKYGRVTPQKAKDIIERHIKKGEVIQEWTLDALSALSEEDKKSVLKDFVITLCDGPACSYMKQKKFIPAIEKELTKHNIKDKVRLNVSGCLGMCDKGPLMIVNPGYTIYGKVQEADIPEIIESHLVKGKPVNRLIIEENHLFNRFYRVFGDVDFFGKQMRITLRNCGIIDPESIDDYLSLRGYEALAKVLTSVPQDDVIKEIKESGLRGRGGAGFPTGLKWEFVRKSESDEKYVICNADEGDPGAFMDRSAIEGDPHTILEGMAIAGYAVGASKGVIYIRAEYPLAIKRLRIAIADACENNLLGKNIFGTDFSFEIEIRYGAGAFVCGEETALIQSIEGSRGMPRPRPPYPAVKGLFDKPSLINNVETWANVPVVILEGAKWFSSIGTEKSKGTKVFALAGKIKNTGLVEVPMGTALRKIIYDIGGGIPDGKKFKAIQIGGPSGGCIVEKDLDTQVDYESLQSKGAMMGSGGMIVIDEDSCMVNVAKFFLEFTQNESCGKCVPCREGTKRMLEILTRITEGRGVIEDIDKLRRLGNTIKKASLCGLGQTAPNAVLSTLNYFMDEYVEHIKDKKCRAGVCKNLINYEIQDNCVGCGLCKKKCPVDAISGDIKKKHEIDQDKCIKCGLCWSVCKFNAIAKK
ncbi:MAG: NADH-quinone oxidoreductase subunit NuoF [Candidatus Omnitrophica bacterium]|nr:NADH-quinone oxidoreductase subunit NuoF [Candidatus Omnitrophota bacterium]